MAPVDHGWDIDLHSHGGEEEQEEEEEEEEQEEDEEDEEDEEEEDAHTPLHHTIPTAAGELTVRWSLTCPGSSH